MVPGPDCPSPWFGANEMLPLVSVGQCDHRRDGEAIVHADLGPEAEAEDLEARAVQVPLAWRPGIEGQVARETTVTSPLR